MIQLKYLRDPSLFNSSETSYADESVLCLKQLLIIPGFGRLR